jgi:hypothetical protein
MDPPTAHQFPPIHSCDACASLLTFVWDNISKNKSLFSLTLPEDWRARAWIPVANGSVRYGDAAQHGQNGCALLELLTTYSPRDNPSDILVAKPSYTDPSQYRLTYGHQFSTFSEVRKVEIYFAWQSSNGEWARTSSAIVCALEKYSPCFS